jgi:DNA-binding transcriptional ArsR family regulator
MTNTTAPPKLDDVLALLPTPQRKGIERRAAELISEEMSLRELRKALELTQTDIAEALDKRQHEISRIEQRGDMLLSTLTRLVHAMGGELELVCRFKDRAPVRLVTPPHLGRKSGNGANSRRRSKRSTR